MIRAASPRDHQTGDHLVWLVVCPWCRGSVPGPFLMDASFRLARHAVESHLYELRLLEIAVTVQRQDGAT
jgi:hypothetical protein